MPKVFLFNRPLGMATISVGQVNVVRSFAMTAVEVKEKIVSKPLISIRPVGVKLLGGAESFTFNDKVVLSASIRQVKQGFFHDFLNHFEKNIQDGNIIVDQLAESCHADRFELFRPVKLFHLLELMRSQINNGSDLLLMSGRNNVAKVLTSSGKKRMVIFWWEGNGNCKKYWSLDSMELESVRLLQEGIHIVSSRRNF